MIKEAIVVLAISVLPITSQASYYHTDGGSLLDSSWSKDSWSKDSWSKDSWSKDSWSKDSWSDDSWSKEYTGTNNFYSGTTSWSYQREVCFNEPDTEVSTVPLPGAVFLFGSALLGFMGFKRFNKQ